MRVLPYSLPIFITLIFISSAYGNLFWIGPFLIPATGFLHRLFGKFTTQQLIDEYDFFHHSKNIEIFNALNGVFFIAFNIWIFDFLLTNSLSIGILLLFIYSVIIINSNFSISLAHELMHADWPMSRFFATILLLVNGFFYLEADHIYIHHRHVGTEGDPASAKLREPLYKYLFRSIPKRAKLIFGVGNILPIEKKKKIVTSNIIRLFVCILFLTACYFINTQIFIWILLQYIFVTLIYEVITYIQHYGLRRTTDDENVVPVMLHHSWNCNYKLSAYMHFMMPVHSIHHLKKEPVLSSLKETGPMYPYPFARMVIAALIPSYWFKLMNNRAISVQKNSV